VIHNCTTVGTGGSILLSALSAMTLPSHVLAARSPGRVAGKVKDRGKRMCAVTLWSQWSVCSATCGPESFKYRRRTAAVSVAGRKLNWAAVCDKPLERKRQCVVPPCIRELHKRLTQELICCDKLQCCPRYSRLTTLQLCVALYLVWLCLAVVGFN
jgi:hypothetical protein